MKTSAASLKERLSDWTNYEMTWYHLGACLGFWPEFGAPTGEDPWHGIKGVEFTYLRMTIAGFIYGLISEGCLEQRDSKKENNNEIEFRWNPNYKGVADLVSMLE